MIYPVEGGFVISSHGTWLPGVYADERAAKYAFRLTDAQLAELNDSRGAGAEYRPIQFEDVRRAKGAPHRLS